MAIDKKISPSLHTLDKCNPRLSGNIKFVCDDDNIYIDSINSNPELSRSLYKSYKVNETNNLMANAKNFFDLFTTTDNIFSVKGDKDYVVSTYENQHDRIYNYGAYSDVSELLTKRFRFFAPVFINEEANKPDLFLIYRVNRDEFNNNKSWKRELLYTHDFRISQMGKQLDRHIDYLKNFPHDMGVFLNLGDNISYTGTSIKSGLMEARYEDDFNSLLANERTITEFNDYVVDGFKRNGVIDSRYLNLEYSFDIDLSKDEVNDTFVDVIGVYVTLDEFNNIKEYNSSDYDFKLLEDNGTLRESITEDINELDLRDNFINVGDYLGLQYNSPDFVGDFPPIVMIKPTFIPNVGDIIALSFEGNTEISYIITEDDIVSNNIMETAENIAKSFKEYTRLNPSNLFLDAFIHDGEYLVIRSLLNDSAYNGISVTLLPQQYQIINPLFTNGVDYDNTFYSPSTNSVLVNSPIGISLTGADSLRIGDTISKITYGSKWLSFYFFDTEEPLKILNSDPELFETIRTEKSKMYECTIAEHRKFDFDRETTYHEDVFDFELTSYRNWLLSEINKDTFLGKYEGLVTTPEILAEYKTELIGIVERYFESISLNRSMLFKDVSTDDFQATTVTNEYDRLKENDNKDLLKSNMTVQHINKFMYANGLDVYNRPYMLNINLPFRYGNFAPSLDNTNRDLRDSTHSWLVIGEGLPPYFSSIDINGNPVIKEVEVETEQVINIIDRIYEDIGVQTDIDVWNVSSVNLSSQNNGSSLEYRQLSSLGFIDRPVNISQQASTSITNFQYKFNIESAANLNVNIRIQLVSVLNQSLIYKTWDINENVIGGETLVIDDIVKFKLPLGADDVILRFSIPVGHSCIINVFDFNFFKGTLTQNTLDENIKFDCDDIQGTFKYLPDIVSGYTTVPISVDDVKSTNTDVYNFIRSHSIIRKEDDNGTCFFRGLKCVVNQKYVGWKFSAVLITKVAPIGEDRSIQLYENNTFKSLTLVVNMYIPEPVLTSLEQPEKYWLDRSLLYFSDGNYSTDETLSSFGLENFSVKIHDVGSPKTYLGNIVTNDWYYQNGGDNFVHVNKGILTRFNVNFPSLLELGNDFTVLFSNIDDAETVDYGMLITFKEIQEAQDDYFWCKEITVNIKETNSGVTTEIEYNMLETFLNNNEAFLEENKMDIVEAILLENAKYNKLLRNTSAIDRFSLLSTASIFEWLSSNKVQVNVEDDSVHFDTISAFKPIVKDGVIRYKEVNNNIVDVDLKYTNTFVRQNGAYNPVTKLLRKSSGQFDIEYCDYGYSNKASNNELVPVLRTNLDRSMDAVWFYRNDYSNTDLEKHFRYYLNRKDFITLPWSSNPIEYKHEISRILSSQNSIVFNHIYDGESIDIYDKIKNYLSRVMNNTGFKSRNYTMTEKIDIIKLSNPNIDEKTFDQFDFEDVILRRFYKSVINDIYTVISVDDIVKDEKLDFFEEEDDIIQLNDVVPNGTEIKITVNRL